MNRIFLPLWGFLLLGCQAPLVTATDLHPPTDETLWRVVPKSVHDGDTLRVERLGVWAKPGAVPPWEWRRR